MRLLEIELHCQLHLSLSISRIGDHSKIAGTIGQVGIRGTHYGSIRGIEGFGSEFEPSCFGKLESAEQGKVQVSSPIRPKAVSSHCAECSCWWVDKRRGIDWVGLTSRIGGRVRVRIPYLIGSLNSIKIIDPGDAVVILHIIALAAMQRDDAIQLPVSDDVIHDAI